MLNEAATVCDSNVVASEVLPQRGTERLGFTAAAGGGPDPGPLYLVLVPIPPEAGVVAEGSQQHPFPGNSLQKQKPPDLRGYVPLSPPSPHTKIPHRSNPQSVPDWSGEKGCPCLRGALHAQSSLWDQAGTSLQLTASLTGFIPA